MRINFAQFPIYDGIKKEKLIANNITISPYCAILSGRSQSRML